MQVAPAEIFTGYTSDGVNLTIPLAALPGLTAAEADPTTGNVMEVSRQIVDRLHSGITALAPEAKPTKATVTKPNPSIATGVGVTPGTLRQGYSLTFDLTPTALELASEA
ncbi:hypothetical protein [Microcoleus sp. B4-C1]|uniref:hypothetical protein n=1 Tax=Microcoleus sp. B4-C1 TaxID=2818660 RepID=UPI002FD5DADA